MGRNSRWRPIRVVEGGRETRYARCFPCERYYRVPLQPRELIYIAETVRVGEHDALEPGWYCRECLTRARRTD